MHILNNSKVYGFEIKGNEHNAKAKVWRLDDPSKIVYLRSGGCCGNNLHLESFYQKDGTKLMIDTEDGKAIMTWRKLEPESTKCNKCGGSGTFRWSVHSGQCNHCQGKGHQTLSDKVRNANYIPLLKS